MEVSSPSWLSGKALASYFALHVLLLWARAQILLIHVFLPFVMYGKKGKMNGRSLIGAAGDAPPGPLWRDPFGKKAGEAARRGFPCLISALADGPAEQVCFLWAASVSVILLCLFWRTWEVGPLCSAEWCSLGWIKHTGSLGQESHRTLFLGWMLDPLYCRGLTTMEKLGKSSLGL